MFGHPLKQIPHLKNEVADDSDELSALLFPRSNADVQPRSCGRLDPVSIRVDVLQPRVIRPLQRADRLQTLADVTRLAADSQLRITHSRWQQYIKCHDQTSS
jgi:hypothetical protein